jgi:hypothetical protein
VIQAEIGIGGLDDGWGILVERGAMGNDRTASAEEPAGGAQNRRSAGDQRNRSRAQDGLPLAGLPIRLWSADHDLQSLSSLDDARPVAAAV